MAKKLLIIDSHSLIYKCFFGVRPMATTKGLPTNAINGFVNILLKLIDTYQPDFVFAAFDEGKNTFRTEEYKDYKAGRAMMPEDLLVQMPYIKNIIKAVNIPLLSVKRYEADDIIGSVCNLAEKKGIESVIVTGDRDSFQLASDITEILYAKRGISDTINVNKKYVNENYGIEPKQFIDVKALMGDKSDNIPGVAGVGEKTALNLIIEYGNLDNIYQNIDKIKGKLKDKLLAGKESAYLSRFLAEIKCDMQLDINLDEKTDINISSKEFYNILEELEFKNIIKRLHFNFESAAWQKEKKEDEEALFEFKELGKNMSFEEMQKFLKSGNDISVYFSKDYRGEINEICIYDGNEFVISSGDGEEIEKIFSLNKNIISYDFKDIFKYYKKKNREIRCGFDVSLMAYVINSSDERYSLEVLVNKYLDRSLDEENKGVQQSFIDMSDISDDKKSIMQRAKGIYDLYKLFIAEFEEENLTKLYNDIEHPLMYVLADMELIGFKADIDMLYELEKEFDLRQKDLTAKIRKMAGKDDSFNINSTKQLGEVLFEELNLPVIKKTKTGYSTDIEVLEKLKGMHPIIDDIIELRAVAKINSTYIKGFLKLIDDKTGKIHSTFNQTITTTGRISSSNPNLQNIPIRTDEGKVMRKVFIPSKKENILIDADYSQIELRVLAHISNDEKLKEAFRLNQDIHTRTASEVFSVEIDEVTSSQRSRAKAVNFGIVYGMSDFGLSKDLNISRKEAKEYIDTYLEKYPNVQKYMHDIVEEAKESGFVTTLFNRRRYIPEINSRNFNLRSFGERTALNTPIQGSAADIIKIAMVNVYKRLKKEGLEAKLILQVHDELILDCPIAEKEKASLILKEEMENAVKLSVDLKVDLSIGKSWYDAKE